LTSSRRPHLIEPNAGCPAQTVIRNLAALRPRRSQSATRACATALALPPAAARHPGHSVRPFTPAPCVPAAPPLRRSARAARHCPPLVGGQLPAGRPVTPAAQFRLTAGSRCASPQRRGAGGCTGGGPTGTLWRSPTRARASPVRKRWLQSWRRGCSARSGPAFASERSQWNRMRCRAWKQSVLHAQTLSPARPASSFSRAVGKVSVHDASGFAADLEKDFATSLPRRGRVGVRAFPDCF
jgi:hypothetical protein